MCLRMFSVAQAVPCCFLVTSLLAALAALSCALCTCLISDFELTKGILGRSH